MSLNEQVIVAAVGDYNLDEPNNPEAYFDLSGALLRNADIAFCQLEAPYGEKGSMGSNGPRGTINRDAGNLKGIPAAGFDVVSMAGNHVMDWGREGLFDCIERLREYGVTVIGAGASIEEARRPAIFERKGNRIAFLAYCSVAPSGYYATPGKAGVAPMRAITHYEPFEEDQPGTPCDILTFPVPTDVAAMAADIKSARERADVVIVSQHWGVHGLPYKIADYQPAVAHAAIDAGADIVFGHHAHMLKGIEMYKGRAILYSIGNFAMNRKPETRAEYRRQHDQVWMARRQRAWNEALLGVAPREQAVEHGYHGHTKTSMILKLTIGERALQRVSFIPVMIDERDHPEPVPPHDPRGQAVIEDLRIATEKAGMNAALEVAGDEVLIC